MEINSKLDSIGAAFEEFKKLNDKRLEEIEKKGAASSETTSAVEKANKHIESLQDEIKAIKTAMNRSSQDDGTEGRSFQEIPPHGQRRRV
jgi:uncharacterized coiled-coil DUF342 family protein